MGWSIVVATAAAAMAALGRAVLGRLVDDRGTAPPQRGSFDTWPTVPLAPTRLVANGSHVPTGS
jgi:hypothetical protein